MAQDNKELLLKDLCARLPYGVKCKIAHSYKHKTTQDIVTDTVTLTEISHISPECYFEETDEYEKTENVKPYLRPMSSMTENEKKEYAKVIVKSQDCSLENSESATTMANDWLLSKEFDVRGLIPKGLALEAPEGMYNLEKK